MKKTAKIISVLLSVIILFSSLAMSAFAWTDSSLMLAAQYNEDAETITVYYRVLHFAGTESADFRLKFTTSKVSETSIETAKLSGNEHFEAGISSDREDVINMVFADLYYVKEDVCESDGSKTIATMTFKVKDTSTGKITFSAYTDSYNMDPDSREVSVDRVTLEVPVDGGSTFVSTDSSYEVPEASSDITTAASGSSTSSKIKMVIIAICIVAAILIASVVVFVIKTRKDAEKEEAEKNKKAKKNKKEASETKPNPKNDIKTKPEESED